MQTRLEKGIVTRVTGGEVWVEVGGDVVACLLRGRLRAKEKDFQIVAGDRVEVGIAERDGGVGTIEKLLPRDSWLARYVDRDASERQIVANVDTLFVVATLKEPRVHYDFVDRVLVAAESGSVRSCVVLNKIDLADGADIDRFAATYDSCGYPVIRTSALTGAGVENLSKKLGGGVYAFVGESGVGKSSLLMKIDPGLDLKVRALGGKSGRGRHTTTYSQLFKFGGGFLADTPGIQTFGFPGRDKQELSNCFPEFAGYEEDCKFYPCTHSHEPDCGVKRALEAGVIEATRYRSYLHILSEVEERIKRASR